jgi:predicted amidohydrolase
MPAVDQTDDMLKLSGKCDLRVNGSWRKQFSLEESTHYLFHAEYRAQHISDETNSVLVEIDWKDDADERVATPDYPKTLEKSEDGWRTVEAVLPVPDGADHATIDLIFRWSEQGKVEWRNVAFEPCDAPTKREVKIATVNFRPQRRSTTAENLILFSDYVHEAGKQGADIVCLGEGITVVSTNEKYVDVAESIPGPTTFFLGKLAKEHGMYIVAGIYEQAGDTVFNTSVLIGRDGELVGKYRKVCLPREEINGGITPGTDYPVFDLDFGRVGMMICWDVHFPEVARGLAKNGAEMILMPIWGGNELLFPARVIENQVYLVTSGYDAKTGIWDREGTCVSSATENGTLAMTTVDLEDRVLFPWLGDFKARIFREDPLVK